MNKKLLKKTAIFTALSTSLVALAACGGNAGGEGVHTYNTYLSIAPATWNSHNWETNEESYIQSFTEMGLYDCILNSTKDGYEFVTEMASAFPVDPVAKETLSTAERLEIAEMLGTGSNLTTGQVWDIELNEDAKWQDGTAITAQDYYDSMELQLSPKYVNYRADSYYASSVVIANAEAYNKSQRTTLEPAWDLVDINATGSSPVYDEDAFGDGTNYINIGVASPFAQNFFAQGSDDPGGSLEDTTITLDSLLSQLGGDDTFPTNIRLACLRVEEAVQKYLLWEHVLSKAYDEKNEVYAADQGWEQVEDVNDIEDEQMNEYIDMFEFADCSKPTERGEDYEITVRTVVNPGALAEEQNVPVDNFYELYSDEMMKDDLNTIAYYLFSTQSWVQKSWAWVRATYVSFFNDINVEFEDVGIKMLDDHKIRIILEKPMSSLDLKFSLTSNWLVNTKLYKKLTKTLQSGSLATEYGTKSAANYMSYGPYKLESFGTSGFTIVRNEQWYGYSDGNHEGQFQMDRIYTRIITDHETARQEFMAGRLDDLELDNNDMKTYGKSWARTTTPESYTQKISFNSDFDALADRQGSGINKTILNNIDFRRGLSLVLDRKTLASTTTAGSTAFTGLLNNLYISDVQLGEMYRETTQGKSVYSSVYGKLGGTTIGEDKALAESEQGFNHTLGVQYIKKAIEDELAATATGETEHLNKTDTISLELRVYDSTTQSTIDLTTFLSNAFNDAINEAVSELQTTDPSIQVKFKLTTQNDQDYYNTAKTGNYDMIFSIWGGAAINPYGLMQVYCDSTFINNCEYGFRGKQDKTYLDIDLDGNGEISSDEHRTFDSWYNTLAGKDAIVEPSRNDDGEFDNDAQKAEYNRIHKQRLDILAALETGILNRFEAVPLVARGTSSLTSWKIKNATDNYVNLVGYGGIRFMTFRYDDAQWNKAVKATNNGDLSKMYADSNRPQEPNN